MTGVALLAQGVTTPEPAFYETFFATVAVLIPVFFLAVAVQGRKRIGDDTAPYVLGATIILVIAAGWGPAVAYAKALGSGHADSTPPAPGDQPATVPPVQPAAQGALSEHSGNGPPGGASKTDTGISENASGRREG
jgi:hypothetical protein